MAKYCSNCGKKLNDNQKCDCQKNHVVKKEEKDKQIHEGQSILNDSIRKYVEVVKGMFTKPIDTIKTYATSENFVFGLIMIFINSVVTGLFGYLLLKESISLLSGMGMVYYGLVSFPKISFKFVLLLALFMIVGFSSTAGMLYLFAGPVMKTKADIKQIFTLVGVCSVLTTFTTIVVILCMYFSMTLVFIILVFAGVLYFTYLYQGFLEFTNIDKNRVGVVFTVSIAVASFLVLYVMPRILN